MALVKEREPPHPISALFEEKQQQEGRVRQRPRCRWSQQLNNLATARSSEPRQAQLTLSMCNTLIHVSNLQVSQESQTIS